MRTILLVLLGLAQWAVAGALAAAPIPWHTKPVPAAAVAAAQQKILFVYYRAACDTCNAQMDALLEQLANDAVFSRAVDAFLPLRITSGEESTHPIAQELAKRSKPPLLAFYDATGVQLSVIEKPRSWQDVAEAMLAVRGARGMVAVGVGLRQREEHAAADFATGKAMLSVRQFQRAAERLARAATAFRAAGDEESAQVANVAEGAAWFGAGNRTKGQTMVAEVLRKPVSDAVAAEAHLAYGEFHEAMSRWAVRQVGGTAPIRPGGRRPDLSRPAILSGGATSPMLNARALRVAIDSYRKAFELAAPGSAPHVAATRALARLDDRPLPATGSDSPMLRIVAPARPTLTGHSDFVIQAQDEVVRLDVYLDDRKVTTADERPFRVSIDVGPTPRVRTIKAVGLDTEGKTVGEALLTINDRQDVFLVGIVAPSAPVISGKQNVELDVKVPTGRKLERIELSWNDRPVATLTAPPFRASLDVPAGEFGYLRAAGVLDDGTASEVTRVYNASGVSESVEVATVTVLANVFDAAGKSIAGLQSGDFTIEEEGRRVAASLRSSQDDPVTIGIAIDTSSSMRGKQLYTIRAAAEFLRGALRPQDEAFVVAFDIAPRLVQGRTRDAEKLQAAVYELIPAGATSIFDGVTFALQQFQGLPGKKALVVLSDGLEGTSTASAAECDRLARTLGVPIYVIVPPGGERLGNALRSISDVTGGRMLYGPEQEVMSGEFAALAEEIRAQYVLAFTRPAGVVPGSWRTIGVRVAKPDARVRTIQGYRAN